MSAHGDFFTGGEADPSVSTSTGLESPQGISGTDATPGLPAELDWSEYLLFGADTGSQHVVSPRFAWAMPDFDAQVTSLTFSPPTAHRSRAPPCSSISAQYQWPELEPATYQEAMDEFFAKNGAWRPAEPCNHCKRLRLQCFILNTTEANPNPVDSCSSCVALFRICSLAERAKRGHSQFETSRPVIGHLHGVNEEEKRDNEEQEKKQQPTWRQTPRPVTGSSSAMAMAPLPSVTSKRSSSRSVRKTQVLRDWFALNIQDPYPTDDEKTVLAERSGLSRTQVVNWFTNARRRHRSSTRPVANKRTLGAASPMPRSPMSTMTPFERWRHSPPDGEAVSEAAIQEAIGSNLGVGRGAGVPGDADELGTSASTDSNLGLHTALRGASDGSFSNSSRASAHTTSDAVVLSERSSEDGAHPAWVKSAPARWKRSKVRCTFVCSYCSRSFNKKYDGLRHERTVHGPGGTSWVCAIPLPPEQPWVVWRLGQTQAECVLCGQAAPTEEHFQSHEFESCAQRAVQDRSFNRKDHMWQHLYKFHGCRKWQGWNPDMDLLRDRAEEKRPS
ncbi:Homeodomain-related protein [Metarhizium album ARSEF 1941]|uniref:Homeodomain-related protein n=1 Tax=Metarhizium album (strain ARSEF 1941) TaxID=1081103 RepID=A0A0B2WRU8_METAS|nr:Homeodomain-related protein [Metarhizium album ARSEF 1941]KHN98766.1 Homeodomain-related protein [Metarhizium album ARSEF 1941]